MAFPNIVRYSHMALSEFPVAAPPIQALHTSATKPRIRTYFFLPISIHLFQKSLATKLSAAGDIGSRLHNIDLAFHVSPLDVLILVMKDALDFFRRCSQASNHFVSQHLALSADRNFSDSTSLIKRQQAVFFRSSQDLNRICNR